MADQPKNKRSISLSTRILIGLILGLLVGLFFGEKASNLAIIGKAYVGLIQMSILPYMVVSLMLGIGSLSYEKAVKLAITGGIVLGVSWILAFSIVFLMPLAFPYTEAGSFFSTSLVEVAEVDFIDLYIPVNPFSSLARTVVPAAAVFSVAFGIALIGVENKQSLLDILSATSRALSRIAMMVVKLTPIGVFAITANAAGTMTIDEFGRLQSYIIPFIVATLILTFWILPGLTAALTPFSYREILKSARDALTTGFVTGNLFITLPMLVENARKLFEDRRIKNDDTDNFVEVLVPTSFNFPNIGKLLTLLFVLFAGWFVGKNVALTDYPGFAVLGLFTLFGGVDLALPFLLDQMKIPSDMYQLYVVTGVLNSWFATLLAVMNLFAFTIVATCAATDELRINQSRIFTFSIISLVIFVSAIIGTRFVLSAMVSKDDITRRTLMHSEIDGSKTRDIYKGESKNEVVQESPLEPIIKRGKLRVGYHPENMPFSFINDKGDLVGLDVELMHILARDLKIDVEFIEWTYETVFNDLNENKFDIAIGGLIVNPERLAKADFSNPYIDMNTALVAKDHLRNKLKSWRFIDEKLNIRLGVVGERRAKNVKQYLMNTEIVVLETYSEFFTDNPKEVDALVISAEAGSAWTILYPSFSVVLPEPHQKAYAAFATPMAPSNLEGFLNDWLQMKQKSGHIDKLYNKWILGEEVEQKQGRWSMGRDLFGLWD
jgi:Na+/H+-dicarboxylate symporter/ABC-type amino acid transport substrate-binding protein